MLSICWKGPREPKKPLEPEKPPQHLKSLQAEQDIVKPRMKEMRRASLTHVLELEATLCQTTIHHRLGTAARKKIRSGPKSSATYQISWEIDS